MGWGGVERGGGSGGKGEERGRWGGVGRGREEGVGKGRGGLSDVVRSCIVQYTLQISSYKPCAFSLLHPRQLWSEREPSLQPLEQLGEGRGGEVAVSKEREGQIGKESQLRGTGQVHATGTIT